MAEPEDLDRAWPLEYGDRGRGRYGKAAEIPEFRGEGSMISGAGTDLKPGACEDGGGGGVEDRSSSSGGGGGSGLSAAEGGRRILWGCGLEERKGVVASRKWFGWTHDRIHSDARMVVLESVLPPVR